MGLLDFLTVYQRDERKTKGFLFIAGEVEDV